jgi:hypothetical protein
MADVVFGGFSTKVVRAVLAIDDDAVEDVCVGIVVT